MMATKNVLSTGVSKTEPFTICIFANPFIESLWHSGRFVADPIMTRQADFDASAQYIAACILGLVPGQAEHLFDAPMAAAARIVSIFNPSLAPSSAASLVAEDDQSTTLLVARRDSFKASALEAGEVIDVGIAVSASSARKRASSFLATDDDTGAGTRFVCDGATKYHRLRTEIPGATAIHVDERSLTPLHEFQHALGSYTNYAIVDLYVDSGNDLNCKNGRPIPPGFCTYEGRNHASDPVRDGLAYPPRWTSYHCALIDSGNPAVMDD